MNRGLGPGGPPDKRFRLEVAIFVQSITSRGTTTLYDILTAFSVLHRTMTDLTDRGSGWSWLHRRHWSWEGVLSRFRRAHSARKNVDIVLLSRGVCFGFLHLWKSRTTAVTREHFFLAPPLGRGGTTCGSTPTSEAASNSVDDTSASSLHPCHTRDQPSPITSRWATEMAVILTQPG